jgi:hypothetical protein
MRETKTANRPAPWPQRLSAETLAPAVRRLLGTPTRGREGEQGAGQQRPARAEEVQQDSRKRPRRCGRPEGGRGAAALQRLGTGKRRRGVGRSRTRDAPRSQVREADVFWATGGLFAYFLSLGYIINFFLAKFRIVTEHLQRQTRTSSTTKLFRQ